MDEIYRKAARVNVWLGPSTPATDAAISSLKKTSLFVIAAKFPGPFLDWRKGLLERRVADLRGIFHWTFSSIPTKLLANITRQDRMQIISHLDCLEVYLHVLGSGACGLSKRWRCRGQTRFGFTVARR